MSRKNQRGSVRRSFTRLYNELTAEMAKDDNKDEDLIQSLWKRLEDRFNQLEKMDDEVMSELCERGVGEAEMDEEYDQIQEYRDKWTDLNRSEGLIRQQEKDQAELASVTSQVSTSLKDKSRYKLPKLKLVEFNGSPREWLTFWSQFKGINDDESMSSEEKFQYLIQATVDGSVARRVVKSFPPTGENYEKAIQHLKSRFGKENVLVEVYVRDLLKLVLKNTNGEQRLSLATLYDELETQLRSLESLGVTSDKYAAMLYPLVESSLSEEVLVAWERIRNQRGAVTDEDEDQLKQLMKFLQGEVESSVRLSMAKRGVISDDESEEPSSKKQRKIVFETATTTDLFSKSSTTNKCIFCGRLHQNYDCTTKLTLNERYAKIREAGKCFKCLHGNHLARNCKSLVKCTSCSGTHYKLLCTKDGKRPLKEINAYSAYSDVDNTILQTLLVNIVSPVKTQAVRAMIDSGSGRSYVTSAAVNNFGLKSVGTIELAHSLFGGYVTSLKKHSVYDVEVMSIDGSFGIQYRLIEVEKICGTIDPTPSGPWLNELALKGIQLSDKIQTECPIHMLIGANIGSKLYTGKLYETKSGLVAFETRFGWTLMGVLQEETNRESSNMVSLVHSMYISTARVQELWNLDIIGIHDPAQEKTKIELQKSALIHFESNVSRWCDGRYEVSLPWIEGHQPVSKNKEVAERRLHSSWSKLSNINKTESYQKVFDQWLELGIIEEVIEENEPSTGISYLPHHPVINEKSSTTPIRPVFDASAKSRGCPSLNDCLEKGQNLLQEIPSLLVLFRMKRYAAIADIEKAFLQISVKKEDRDYLRFVWYKYGKIIILRHCRVVFGISSSPFLLAATINHHLKKVKKEYQTTAKLLQKSTYVDNCLVSVDTNQEREKFMRESTEICAEAKFNLRGWVWNRGEVIAGDVAGVGSPECGLATGSNASQETSVSVLGLLWNVVEDTLSLDVRKILSLDDDTVTKRTILAATHQIFDPIGLAAPAVIVPKMLLQELCKKKKFKWDTPVPDDIKKRFLSWRNSLHVLSELKIPRWTGRQIGSELSLHIFTDASSKAYATIAFLRSNFEGTITVQLLLAKSRVSTIKPITTPRLELVACECGAKMSNYLQKTIDVSNIETYFWSDSGNALSWIKRKENWQVFVFNRVKTINQYSNADCWNHVPGYLNPADLPSRGCSNKRLLESRWWEGPEWLKKEKEFWPKSAIIGDEEIIMSEKKRVVVSHLIQENDSTRYFKRFSDLRKVIRMIAWMRRWKLYKRNQKRTADLTLDEEDEAEKCLWRMIQNESFTSSDKVLTQMNAKKDVSGIWRVETKLLRRNDTEDFRRPILLPKDHIAVVRLVEKEHLDMQHCSAMTLRNTLRERFWILNSRVVARRVTTSCIRCKRYTAKKMTAPEPSLPLNRVKDTATFEVVGIDLGGPLHLLDGTKAWFVLSTCAVYRAVHLELITSLSTPAFIQALRRFIARRGRPQVIYTDNGTNFVGTENLMDKLNWEEISTQSEAKRIKWIFNPPSAPWWGGWWERIVGLIKQLLRRCLDRVLLDYEEMTTVLCDIERIINSRPLTYVSEDPEELTPITPMMFLNDAKNSETIDLDIIESSEFGKKYLHRQNIRQELRERFRKEYLSLLVHQNVRKSGYTPIKVGDVVIMEVENKKRVDWPIAKILETYPSEDGIIRSVKVRVSKNGTVTETTRPIQRLYMLETSADLANELVNQKTNTEEENTDMDTVKKNTEVDTMEQNKNVVESEPSIEIGDNQLEPKLKVTRSGRTVNKPIRFEY